MAVMCPACGSDVTQALASQNQCLECLAYFDSDGKLGRAGLDEEGLAVLESKLEPAPDLHGELVIARAEAKAAAEAAEEESEPKPKAKK